MVIIEEDKYDFSFPAQATAQVMYLFFFFLALFRLGPLR